MKQTKIVASISDRRCDQDFIRKLFFAGMNVVRMNTAHATEEGIRTIVKNVRAVSPHIGIMIDTKGPEVRTTGVKEPIHYNVGDVVKIFGRPEMESSHDIVNVSYPDIAADVKVGDDLLFDDGELDMKIIDSQGPMLVAEVAQPVGAYCAFEEIPRHWGVMTLKGKVIVDAKYEKVEIRDNGIAVVTGITGKTQTIKLLKVKE